MPYSHQELVHPPQIKLIFALVDWCKFAVVSNQGFVIRITSTHQQVGWKPSYLQLLVSTTNLLAILISLHSLLSQMKCLALVFKICPWSSGCLDGRYIPSRGGNQFTLASQWESRKVRTSPLAAAAPSRRVRISPSRFLVRRIRTFGSRAM